MDHSIMVSLNSILKKQKLFFAFIFFLYLIFPNGFVYSQVIIPEIEKVEVTPEGEVLESSETDDFDALNEDLIGDQVLFEESEKQRAQAENKKRVKKEIGKDYGGVGVGKLRMQGKPPTTPSPLAKGSSNIKFDDIKENEKAFNKDLGLHEKALLDIAKYIERKIPESEWYEIADQAKIEKYVIVKGDYLWKISTRLFGTGFYYPKIWSLNPYITNPHEIEPGMVLVFDTGDSLSPPSVRVSPLNDNLEKIKRVDFEKCIDELFYSKEVIPPWVLKRKSLVESGTYVQVDSLYDYDDLDVINKEYCLKEYMLYNPYEFVVNIPSALENYDDTGFDKDSIIKFGVKRGKSFVTFISTNFVQDVGEINAAIEGKDFLSLLDKLYIEFDSSLSVVPGDKYSIYVAKGEVDSDYSNRSGYKYYIAGAVQVTKKVGEKWEAIIIENYEEIRRGDRLTLYTPVPFQSEPVFNARRIEGTLFDGFYEKSIFGMGDIVYIDRGRADGVEIGNIFEVFDSIDNGTEKLIHDGPVYKKGEIIVTNLTDDFATGIVVGTKMEMKLGDWLRTKSQVDAIRTKAVKKASKIKYKDLNKSKVLDDIDVELDMEDINKNLLAEVDRLELTDDELEELERQEKEKSFIDEHNKDLKELERLEKQLDSAEALLKDFQVDSDKLLEQEDLDSLEGRVENKDMDAMAGLDEIEEDMGKKYLDEDINSKDNPFGLTEGDLEEVDELMSQLEKEETSKE